MSNDSAVRGQRLLKRMMNWSWAQSSDYIFWTMETCLSDSQTLERGNTAEHWLVRRNYHLWALISVSSAVYTTYFHVPWSSLAVQQKICNINPGYLSCMHGSHIVYMTMWYMSMFDNCEYEFTDLFSQLTGAELHNTVIMINPSSYTNPSELISCPQTYSVQQVLIACLFFFSSLWIKVTAKSIRCNRHKHSKVLSHLCHW